MTTAPALASAADSEAAPQWRPRRWIAALLNVLVPGLGQLHAGRPARALGTFVAVHLAVVALVALTFVVPWAPLRLVLLVGVFAIAWPVMAVDGWRAARRATGAERRVFQRWYVLTALLALHAFVVQPWLQDRVKRLGVEAFRIPSASMAPTLVPGDFILVTPGVNAPVRRGDVVVLLDEGGHRRIQRVVGVPGDTLEMRHFQLFLDGMPVVEPYASVSDSAEFVAEEFRWQRDHGPSAAAGARREATSGTWGPLVVPADSLFMLGDYRDQSLDSRYMGFVSPNRIRGRPRWIYFSRDPDRGTIQWHRFGRGVR